MAYMHIDNLYKPEAQRILEFKWVYAMEKIHGTSAHVAWKDNQVRFFAGGISHDTFVKLFDEVVLAEAFTQLDHPVVTVFGEAYGGKIMKMSKVYGPTIRFVAFEVKIDDCWLNVEAAQDVALKLGLDFVHYDKRTADLDLLTELREAPSVQAQKLGMGEHPREGIVLRPPFEVTTNNGERLIAKYKTEAYQERTKEPKVGEGLTLTELESIANEWVTPMRLQHVLDGLKARGFSVCDITATGQVIRAMLEDVEREGKGEIEWTGLVKKEIGKQTAMLFKRFLTEQLKNGAKPE